MNPFEENERSCPEWEQITDPLGARFENKGYQNPIAEPTTLCRECTTDYGPTTFIAEKVSYLGEDINEVELMNFSTCSVEFGLDSCSTLHILNDLKLLSPSSIFKLSNNGVL